jgi:hypothetical protein
MMKLNSKIHLRVSDPDVFPGGPSDKSVLTEYGHHIAVSPYFGKVKICSKCIIQGC